MKSERSIFNNEYKTFGKKRNLVIISIFILLSLLLMQIDMNRLRIETENLKKSSRIQELKATQFKKWSCYGAHGILLASIPSPMNFLSLSKVYSSLYAHIDSEVGLQIYSSRKNTGLLHEAFFGIFTFSGVILLFGGLICLLYGFPVLKNDKDLKMYCILKPFNQVFWGIFLSRMFFVSMTVLLLIICSVLLAFVNGNNIMNSYYLFFTLQTILVLNFFLTAGAAFGSTKKKVIGIVGIIVVYSLNIIAPWIFGILSGGFSNSISEHQAEFEKLQILMAFENRGVQKFKDVRSGDKVKEFIEGFFKNELKLIEEIEKKIESKIVGRQEIFQTLSCIYPGSFFIINISEISGGGFNHYSFFYKFAVQQKHDFIKFYSDKKYLSENAPEKVQSFVKGNSNIYFSKPSLPPIGITLTGIILTLLYTGIFLFFAYRNAYKKVFPKTKTIEDEEDVYIPIERGKITIFFTTFQILNNKIYNHLAGKEKIKGEIELFPEQDFENQSQIDFAYISPDQMNDISPHALHQFLLGEKPDKAMDHWDVLFEYALTKTIAVFDEFQKSRPDKLKELVLKLKEHQVACLIISSDYFFTEHFVDENTRFEYYANEPLKETLKKLKEWLKKQKEQGEKS